MCCNIEVEHIPGAHNQMADYLSRYSPGAADIPEVEIPRPFASSRSLRTIEAGVEIKEPLVHWISEEGENDTDYCDIIKIVQDSIPCKKCGPII